MLYIVNYYTPETYHLLCFENILTTWEWIKYFFNVVLFILQALHGAAVNAGITVMNECGVDPGNYDKKCFNSSNFLS